MIMVRNSNDTYSQVGFIKNKNGVDTEYIYDKNGNVIFEKGFTREISGEVPLQINGIGKDFKEWSISGNTFQDGTPSPDSPVEIQSVGERTKNFFDEKTIYSGIDENGGVYTSSPSVFYSKRRYFSESELNETYTFSTYFNVISLPPSSNEIHPRTTAYIDKKAIYGTSALSTSGRTLSKVTFTPTSTSDYITISYVHGGGKLSVDSSQLEIGSSATSYEPYGYKIPVVISADGQDPITTPIYLSESLRKLGDYADTIEYIGNGQAKITRNIKSLTLTGTETWVFQSVNDYGIYNFYIKTARANSKQFIICNDFVKQTTLIADTQTIGLYLSNDTPEATIYLRVDDTIATDVDTLKSWLASKYEAGSPVIVEYVLDTPIEETIEVPEIPTFNGTTIIDTDTEVKPSNFYGKYKSSV